MICTSIIFLVVIAIIIAFSPQPLATLYTMANSLLTFFLEVLSTQTLISVLFGLFVGLNLSRNLFIFWEYITQKEKTENGLSYEKTFTLLIGF